MNQKVFMACHFVESDLGLEWHFRELEKNHSGTSKAPSARHTSPFSSNFGVTNPTDTAGKKMGMEYIEPALMAKRSVH
jgi:hypothetical protein